jgi:RHS repeat-associated protein
LGLSYEKEQKLDGSVEHKHYVSAGGITFALATIKTASLANNAPVTTSTLSYLHNDHLGSIVAITDDSGAVVERLAYDPWGRRRFTDGKADQLDALKGQKTDRGYTEHEHLDEMGLIHMNGRVYDPLVGRFMSADPFIQAPYNLKSFNRYSYGWNNPLKIIDPTGYFGEESDSGDSSDANDSPSPVPGGKPMYHNCSTCSFSSGNSSSSGGSSSNGGGNIFTAIGNIFSWVGSTVASFFNGVSNGISSVFGLVNQPASSGRVSTASEYDIFDDRDPNLVQVGVLDKGFEIYDKYIKETLNKSTPMHA